MAAKQPKVLLKCSQSAINPSLCQHFFQRYLEHMELSEAQQGKQGVQQMLLKNNHQSKNVVITGGNSGIGLQTARGLYADGHHIIIASRNTAKNNQAIKSITASHPESAGQITSYELDLAKKRSVELFAEHVSSKFTHLDILINNSGLILNERAVSQLGVEMTYAINHFGHFYLTYLLYPKLNKSAEARIINVSSMAHFSASSSLTEDPKGELSWGSIKVYQKSKLANVMFTTALADSLTKYKNIKTVSLHPGIVDSEFGTGLTGFSFFRCICCCVFVNNERGARTSLYVSRIPFEQLQSGAYYHSDTSIKEVNRLANDRNETKKLWEYSQKLYGIKFDLNDQ